MSLCACVLCEIEGTSNDIRPNNYTREFHCIRCVKKFRAKELPIFQLGERKSLIPFEGAVRYKVVAFVSKKSSYYSSPVLVAEQTTEEIEENSETSSESSVELFRRREIEFSTPPSLSDSPLPTPSPTPPPTPPPTPRQKLATSSMGSTTDDVVVQKITGVKRYLEEAKKREECLNRELKEKLDKSNKKLKSIRALEVQFEDTGLEMINRLDGLMQKAVSVGTESSEEESDEEEESDDN